MCVFDDMMLLYRGKLCATRYSPTALRQQLLSTTLNIAFSPPFSCMSMLAFVHEHCKLSRESILFYCCFPIIHSKALTLSLCLAGRHDAMKVRRRFICFALKIHANRNPFRILRIRWLMNTADRDTHRLSRSNCLRF